MFAIALLACEKADHLSSISFYRLPGIEDPQPLWASEDKIRPEQVPTCELCRGERKVEFQVCLRVAPSAERLS